VRLLAALCRLAVSECATITTRWTRLDYSDTAACLLVTNSFLWNLRSQINGGTIFVSRNGNFSLNVTDSALFGCSTQWGGAMCFDYPSLFVGRRCDTSCSASEGGLFIQFGGSSDFSRSAVSFSIALSCAPRVRLLRLQIAISLGVRRF
jgi:hypothetical protein